MNRNLSATCKVAQRTRPLTPIVLVACGDSSIRCFPKILKRAPRHSSMRLPEGRRIRRTQTISRNIVELQRVRPVQECLKWDRIGRSHWMSALRSGAAVRIIDGDSERSNNAVRPAATSNAYLAGTGRNRHCPDWHNATAVPTDRSRKRAIPRPELVTSRGCAWRKFFTA